ncbi:MAG: hypothetical protein ACKOE5_01925 [Cytophagales bacterium]
MAVIIRVTSKTNPKAIQKALTEASKKNRPQKTIADFYGALPTTFEDGLTYQKKLRNEW